MEDDDDDKKSFFHSLFFDREPFEMWVIPPQWTRGIFVARGYASMAGPFPHEMEGVVNFQGSFKISGRPMLLRGTAVGMSPTVLETEFPVVPGTKTEYAGYRYRAIGANLLEEIWTPVVSGTTAPLFAESAVAEQTFQVYEYKEDAGFGTAF